jgi:hypothetical protein
VRQLLKLDLQLAPFTIHALEYEVIHDWTVQQGDTSFITTIGGSIDRLDAVVTDQQERIRVIDYKTGGGKLTYLPDVESIFATNESHNGYYLQTLLYSSKVDNKPMFLKHARFEEVEKCLANYAKTYDLVTCQKLLYLIRSDLKAVESIYR